MEYIIGNNHKEDIIKAVTENAKGDFVQEAETQYSEFDYVESNDKNLSEKVRKYIKIQDGCNNFCTYCAIPYLRGRSRSRSLDNIVREVNDVSKIAKEIVITGINVSDYKIDEKLALGKVFEAIKDTPSRIRMSSLEVNIINDEFLSVLKNVKNFAPHFHLSMQSGSNRILKLMNRHYTTSEFIEKVNLIRKYFPDCAIGTDLIVGFAKETEEDFLETLETIKKVRFSSMHIFEYSEKKGTKGVLLGKSDEAEIKDRLIRVNALANELKHEYEHKFINTIQSVLIEEIVDGYSVGFTGNYIKVYIPEVLPINEFFDIRLDHISDGKVYGMRI